MTYCLALRLDDGLVFLADTAHQRRRRQHRHVPQAARAATRARSRSSCSSRPGSLATTQEVLDRIHRDLSSGGESLATVDHLFEAALYVGRLSREVAAEHRDALQQRRAPTGPPRSSSAAASATERPDILLVYPEGNYIRASDDRPFLQIGESKYGKFMLELAVEAHVDLSQATKIALGSMMSTARANLVGGAALRPRHPAGRRRGRPPGVPGDRGLAAARAAAGGLGAPPHAGRRRVAADHRRRLRSGRLHRLRSSD